MSRSSRRTAFFDIGDTLGVVRFVPGTEQLAALDVYSGVPDIPSALRSHDVRLGIISNKGSNSAANVRQVFEEAGIFHFFDPDLLIYGVKDSARIIKRAAARAGHATSPDQCIFVGESQAERVVATKAGLRVAADPDATWAVLQGAP
jgi:phosphoglycolate phosphatase-like HAD superfamily hydrolase